MAILRRISDGAGDQGSRVEAISWSVSGKVQKIIGYKPIVGCSLLVGSITARSYSKQDYWLTTTIIKILEEKEIDNQLYIKFKTENSVYEFWS